VGEARRSSRKMSKRETSFVNPFIDPSRLDAATKVFADNARHKTNSFFTGLFAKFT
jgi:hypothetical protein